MFDERERPLDALSIHGSERTGCGTGGNSGGGGGDGGSDDGTDVAVSLAQVYSWLSGLLSMVGVDGECLLMSLVLLERVLLRPQPELHLTRFSWRRHPSRMVTCVE